MTDVMTPQQRSHCMSRIRACDTGPEVALRMALWRRGLRYRLRYPLEGKPDLVFVSARVAVFVDGCFWHGCPEHSSKPKNNAVFWTEKLSRNVARDKRVNRALRKQGWTVVRVWEHSLKSDLAKTVTKLTKVIAAHQSARTAKRIM